LLDAGPILSKI